MSFKKGLGSKIKRFLDRKTDKMLDTKVGRSGVKLQKYLNRKVDKILDDKVVKSGIKIEDVMSRAVFISPRATKKELLKIVKRHPQVELFMVANKDKKFIGDIHENDLFLMLTPNDLFVEVGLDLAFNLEKKFFATTARDIMRKHDTVCHRNDDMMDVAKKFVQIELNEMPVLNDKKQVIGFVTQGMILRKLQVK